MRMAAFAITTIATMLTAAPARAQTHNPAYPVCLEAYGDDGSYIECGYTSLAQCAPSASGRSGRCFMNPYFAGAPAVPVREAPVPSSTRR
ncbi:MAG: hypothetical protein JWR80_2465 [Bradyrhizobium sp.]|jgi:hypothetical protein|nr:hypothetical protein [Bradyrhizobium sp.]